MSTQRSKKDIALVICAAFCFSSSFMMVPPIITGFAESLGASSLIMGIIGGLSNIVSLICRPFIGNMTDRFSKIRISYISGILIFIASVGYLLATHPLIISIFRIIAGIGYTCYTVCMATWIAEMAPPHKIGSYMGIFGVALATTMGVAPALGVGIYQFFGYRQAFIAAIIFILLALAFLYFIKNPGFPQLSDSDKQSNQFQLIAWNVLPVSIVMMLFALPFYATHAFLVRYVEIREIPIMAGMFFPIYSAVLVTLRLILKNLFDTVPFQRFMGFSVFSAALGLVCFSQLSDYLLLSIAAAFTAGGFGIMFSVSQANAVILAGPGRRGLGISTFFIAIDLGMSLGPIIGGIIYGHLPIIWFFPTLLIFPIITIPFWWISKKIWH